MKGDLFFRKPLMNAAGTLGFAPDPRQEGAIEDVLKAATVYECVETISEGAVWAFAKWEPPGNVAYEPASRGGQGAGFEPYEAVLAGLGACSAITLRMYAERKQLTIRSLSIDLSFHREGDRGVIRRVAHLDADLTAEQRARFADIIERTPVTLTLKAGSDIRTEFAE